MTPLTTAAGSIPEVIRNDERLYEGNLKQYFKLVFLQAQNVNHPYHNFRHMLHVTWLCYQACAFYIMELSPRKMRNLLIAALFHDFNHSGMMGDDDINIARAIRGLKKHILPEDEESLADISDLIQATEYPYRVPSEALGLREQIIRDADLSQALSPAWIQQVVFGLAEEWKKSPIEVLRSQGNFHRSLHFNTDWAKTVFPASDVEAKIEEALQLLQLVEE